MSDLLEGFLGTSVEGKKSRVPAKLDYVQSATGLFLGLFMWGVSWGRLFMKSLKCRV